MSANPQTPIHYFEMADQLLQTVLRCNLCNKPFDKESTLKRHGYYCRSRSDVTRVKRFRSCMACVKAKARCDNRVPRCTRCVTRDVECLSQSNSTPDLLSMKTSGKKTRKTQDPEGRALADILQFSPGASTPFDGSGQGALNVDFMNYGAEQFEWNMIEMEISELPELDNQIVVPSLLQFHETPTFDPAGSNNDEGYQRGHEALIRSSSASIPTMPTYQLRSFTQRPSIKGRRQTTATLMVNILTSYPMMMRSPDTLPPFIHPYSFSRDVDLQTRPLGSLTTCMSLMQMISTNMPGSRKLLWKNVRLECERIQEEWSSFDKWELLSSMQALLVYILLRLQEGEIMDDSFDVLLLATSWTIQIVAKALNRAISNIPCDRSCGVALGGNREAWIFEESRRRLAITFGTICMLFSIEPSSDCVHHQGFLLIPLPARKQLWEARDERSWDLEKRRDGRSSTLFGIMTDGQMTKLGENHAQNSLRSGLISMEPISSEESNANWQEWCSGMDGLGALIMLAASLPSLYP